jgi:hypothetical protein
MNAVDSFLNTPCCTKNRSDESWLAESAASLLMLSVSLLTFGGAAYFFSAEDVRVDDDKWLDRLAVHATKPECPHESRRHCRHRVAERTNARREESSGPAVQTEPDMPGCSDDAATLSQPSLIGAAETSHL